MIEINTYHSKPPLSVLDVRVVPVSSPSSPSHHVMHTIILLPELDIYPLSVKLVRGGLKVKKRSCWFGSIDWFSILHSTPSVNNPLKNK